MYPLRTNYVQCLQYLQVLKYSSTYKYLAKYLSISTSTLGKLTKYLSKVQVLSNLCLSVLKYKYSCTWPHVCTLDNGPVRKRGKAEPANRPVDVQPRPPPLTTRLLGPCYTCGEYGHLARSCNKSQQPYPFMNKSYDVCHNGVRCPGSAIGPSVLSIKQGASGDGLEQVLNSHLHGVDKAYRQEKPVNGASEYAPDKGAPGVDNTKVGKPTGDQEVIPTKPGSPNKYPSQGKGVTCSSEAYSTSPEPDPYEIWDLEFSRSWEAEEQGVTIQQIVDVQGRLKECIGIWTEVLQAPATVLGWIQNGYKLPLMYAPAPFEQRNHTIKNLSLIVSRTPS